MKSLFACVALAVAAPALADSTLDYDVLYAGTKSGALRTVVGEDGRMHVSFSYRDNGRGPDSEEDIALLPDGTLKSYRQTGRNTYGAILDERFSVSGKRASWQTPADRGSSELAGPALYLPTYGSPEVNAVIVRASQKAGGSIAALPGGTLRVSLDLALPLLGTPARATLTVPDQIELVGAVFHQQAILFEFGRNAFGAVLSDAVTVVLGR